MRRNADHAKKFEDACKFAVLDLVDDFRRKAFNTGPPRPLLERTATCENTGEPVLWKDAQVTWSPSLPKVVDEFIKKQCLITSTVKYDVGYRFEDPALTEAFRTYFRDTVTLHIIGPETDKKICPECKSPL